MVLKKINNPFFAGLTSSCIIYTLTYPVDFMKMQIQFAPMNNIKPSYLQIYKILFNYHHNNSKILFSGYIPHILAYSSFYGIYAGCYRNLEKNDTIFVEYYLDKIIKSYVASSIGSIITNPLHVIKIHIQKNLVYNQKPEYSKIIQNIYNNEGFTGFFKGLSATQIGNLKLCIQFPLNDILVSSGYNKILSATFSTIFGATIFYPFDVIRTYQRSYNNKQKIINCIKKIYRLDNLMGFYRGYIMYLVYSVPGKALTMLLINYFYNPNK